MKLFKEYYKADLSSVVEAERKRLGSEFKITYDKKNQEIVYYKNGMYRLNVWFTKADNIHFEEFYYTPLDDNDALAFCFETAFVRSDDAVGIHCRFGVNYRSVPKEFVPILKAYTDPDIRQQMQIDEVMDKAVLKRKLSFLCRKHYVWYDETGLYGLGGL